MVVEVVTICQFANLLVMLMLIVLVVLMVNCGPNVEDIGVIINTYVDNLALVA
jgi:hypothetical protein